MKFNSNKVPANVGMGRGYELRSWGCYKKGQQNLTGKRGAELVIHELALTKRSRKEKIDFGRAEPEGVCECGKRAGRQNKEE